MTTKRTPGPWIATCDGIVNSIQLGMVATVAQRLHTDERDANARLIAAAPELLHAAEKMVRMYDIGSTAKPGEQLAALSGLFAAIAKAKGE